MKKCCLLACLLCWQVSISVAQGNEELGQIISTVLQSRILTPYLPAARPDQPRLSALAMANRLPSQVEVMLDGWNIPVVRQGEQPEGFAILITRLKWRGDKAQLVLRGPEKLVGRFRLRYWESEWLISKALIHGVATRQGKRQRSWDVML